MKTIIASNSRPPRRALCTLLLCIAALWATPRSAHAQLYVSQGASVSEYDATTGAVINANFITGLNGGSGALAVWGNILFVANFGTNCRSVLKS